MDNGFLNLTNPETLFDKLKHDFELLKVDNNDAYKAFNFFVTAEHLPDWVKDTKIKDNNPFLRISSHLATGAKHFQVTNPKKDSIASESVEVYISEDYIEEDYFETVLNLHLTNKEAKEIGSESISVMKLAEEVLLFWNNYFKTNKK